MNKDEISFQVYRQPITNIKPEKLIILDQFLGYTKDPPRRIIENFDQIAKAELAGDQKLKSKLKQHYLFYYTVCVVVFPIRNYKSIINFTGLLVLDFDHIDNARDFKYFLFEEYKFIVAVWLSPSRRGVKCLVKIPIVQTVDEFKEYYFGIAAEMEQYTGFDPSGQNCVLPLFQSYDPELLSRDDPDTWNEKGRKRNNFDIAPTLPLANIQISGKDQETIIKIINTGFDNITNLGHPPLRNLCLTIGGYVAAGYISEYDAMSVINSRIENHGYLKKGIHGYKKTAQWAVEQGQGKPLTLKKLV